MRNPFTALFRARDKPTDAVSAATTFSFGSSLSGKSVNARTAIQVSTVYACVRVIAETVASLPFAVFEADKSGSQKAFSCLKAANSSVCLWLLLEKAFLRRSQRV